jgi:flagellar protein FlgJ
MSGPIALGRTAPPLSPPGRLEGGANALTAPTTPGRRVAVVDKSKVDPQTLKAAEGMESMFLDYMMKVMRQTVPKNDMDLESPATQVYQSMLDSEVAEKAAHTGGVGLADQIVAYLESERYNLSRGQAVPVRTEQTRRTGGTHEGQPNNE